MSNIEFCGCEACGKRVNCETTHSSLDGVTFCTPCFKEQMESIKACSHELVPYEETDYEGREQVCCNLCGGVFLANQAPTP